jgi:hypothetical protein
MDPIDPAGRPAGVDANGTADAAMVAALATRIGDRGNG